MAFDLDAARRRCNEATPGPWIRLPESNGLVYVSQAEGDLDGVCMADGPLNGRRGNAEFIAHARTDLPAALDEIERLLAILDDVHDGLVGAGRAGAIDMERVESALNRVRPGEGNA